MVCQYLGRAVLASLGAVMVCAGAAVQLRAIRLQPPAPSAPYRPGLSAQIQPIQVSSPTASSPVPGREILNKYCVTCHNFPSSSFRCHVWGNGQHTLAISREGSGASLFGGG
jgi:hypothetical protein